MPGLTTLMARGGMFQISCEGDQLGPFGLMLCVSCDGGYLWTSLRTRWCVLVPYVSVQYMLAAWTWLRAYVCGAVRLRDELSATGCVVYVNIETRAPHFTQVCVRYGVRHMQHMAVCLMCGIVRTRATDRGGGCG